MRRTAAVATLALLVALLALTAWWLSDGPGAGDPMREVADATPDAAAAPATRTAPRPRAARPARVATETLVEEAAPRDEAAPQRTSPTEFPVAVRVEDSRGSAVAGASVRLCVPRGSDRERKTDASGRARFENCQATSAPQGFEILVEAEGFGDVQARAWAGDEETRVVLLRPGRIEGVVVDGEGRPVADAAVRGLHSRATTDATGRFVLDQAFPGADELLAVAGTSTERPEVNEPDLWGGTQVVLGDGETLRDVRIVVARPERSFVTAEAIDAPGGRPRACDMILVHPGGAEHGRGAVRTEFPVPSAPGTTVRLEAFARDLDPKSAGPNRRQVGRIARAEVATAARPDEVRRLVFGDVVDVRFRVLRADGAPVAGPCTLRLSVPPHGSQWWLAFGTDGDVESGVSPGFPFRAAVETSDAGTASFDLDAAGPDGRTYELRLPPAATVRGRVLDADGSPRAHCGVSVVRDRTLLGSAPTAADGSFEIDGVPEGRHRLVVVADAKDPGAHLLPDRVIGGAELSLSGTGDVDVGTLRLWSLTAIRGRVVGPGGRPVAAACVTVTNRFQGTSSDRVTDRDGRFEATVFAGPPVEVRVTRPGLGTEVRALPPVDPRGAEVEVALVPSGSVRIRLAEPAWVALGRFDLRRTSGGAFWTPNGGARRPTPTADVVLTEVPEGSHVVAFVLGERRAECPVVVRAGETSEISFDRAP